ncbi:MAG TPA: DUF1592 domain-containing protein [Polyangiaceae bacterium]|nr:DUF1592 domain-containing protein [Polyangiaceae bacterium]
MTRTEYDNVVRDVLGDDSAPAQSFVGDDKLGLFDANIASSVQDTMVSAYMTSAEALAATAVKARLTALAPCQELGCSRAVLESLGKRLYRRPLTDIEAAGLSRLFDLGSSASGFAHGLELVLQAMLQSPYFLYHVEAGTGAGPVQQLGAYEQAARLSFFLWESSPDEALLNAADSKQLGTPETIAAQARRMLADPRSAEMTRRFYRQWLRVAQLDHLVTDPAMADSMVNELDAFIDQVTWKEGGTLDALFNSRSAFLDDNARRFYGISDPGAPATAAQPYQLDAAQRSGLLTRAPFLAANLTVPARGKFVLNQLLCQVVPDPDPALMVQALTPDPNASERSQWQAHEVSPACKGCHAALDPVGFGFLHYDRAGKYRSLDRTFAIDATGILNAGQPDIDGAYDGAIDLSRRLAKSEAVRGCMSDIWFTVALDRMTREQDACSKEQIREAFAKANGSIPELLVAIAGSPAFSHRRAAP